MGLFEPYNAYAIVVLILRRSGCVNTAASSMFIPLLREITHPPHHWATHFRRAPMQAHGHLAVGNLAQCPTILTRYSNRAFSGLGKTGLINHPYFRFAQGIDDFMGQRTLDRLDLPGALPDKLSQPLDISLG